MPQVIVTADAIRGIERCHDFLFRRNPVAATKASELIWQKIGLLSLQPQSGRPWRKGSDLRELVIPFGGAGYTALYRYEAVSQTVYILAFRHQLEGSY